MDKKRTTEDLNRILEHTRPSGVEAYLNQFADKLDPEEKPFAAYMRERFHEKGILQQEVFLAADISEGFGYKLIAEEKHTRQRDLIYRLCLGAHFTLTETNKALRLYKMAPLSPRDRRDAVLTIALNNGVYEIHEVDELLEKYGFAKLYGGQTE